MGSQELGSDGSTYGEDMSLSQRAGGVLDTAGYLKLGMARGGRTPLTELCQFLESELTDKGEL